MSRLRSVTNALIQKLAADAELLALCPNGVYRANRGPEGASALVEVALQSGTDHPMFNGRADEDLRYTVVATQRIRRGQVSNVGDAAARIDLLLEDGTLDIADFGVMVLQRTAGIDEDSFVSGDDPSLVWDYCGGIYQLMVMSTAPVAPPWVQTGWIQL